MSYVIFGLNVPLLGMNRTCLVKIIYVWQKSHMSFRKIMCGIYHSIIRHQSGWIKAHMCGKNHCQLVF